MIVPENLDQHPGIERLRSGPDRDQGLREAFPEITTYIVSARVVAQKRRFFLTGKTMLDLSAASGEGRLFRMAGRHPGDATTLFELLADGKAMKVYIPQQGQYYAGEIAPEGTPFARKLGVEPWDLASVFALGNRLTEGKPSWISEGDAFHLRFDAANADGLASVEMDPASGLPKKATWKREGGTWEVRYRTWTLFKNSETDKQSWLLPSKLEITSRKTKVRIEAEVKQYRINPADDPRRWVLTTPPGAMGRPLSDLDEGLEHL